ARALPGGDGDAARGDVPLAAAGPRAGEPPRPAPRRGGEGAPLDASGRSGAGGAAVRLTVRGGSGDRGCDSRGRVRARGRGDPLSYERTPDGLRGAAARRVVAVPGLVAPRTGRRAQASATSRARCERRRRIAS